MADDHVVVDASVLAALAFAEPRADEALGLVAGRTLVAPGLLYIELAAVTHKKCTRHPGARTAILAALARVLELDIALVSPAPVAAVELALSTNLTAYDAAYLAVALDLGCPLVTFDRALHRAWRRRLGAG